MNNFLEKKLGEVIAFSEVGINLVKKAGITFTKAMGEKFFYEKKLNDFHEIASTRATMESKKKAKSTSLKLNKMMNTYIGNDWDKPIEILEWLSFYFSAAAAHWGEIIIAAKESDDKTLQEEAEKAQIILNSFLAQVNTRIKVKTEQKLVPV